MRPTITLKKNEDKRLRNGHLWAFSNEIASISGEAKAGDLADVKSASGEYVGTGFYNPHSLIALRLLTTPFEANAAARFAYDDLDVSFFRERIGAALALRKKIFPGADSFRVVHGEADLLPGLTIDYFNGINSVGVASIQTVSYGMSQRIGMICNVVEELLGTRAIVERNDSHLRSYEELEEQKGVLRGSSAETVITEHGIEYSIDVLEGQKTGFYLDMRMNRLAIRTYAQGARVLDCFCNDGGFAFNATLGGASEVTAVEISEAVLRRANANAARNHALENIRFVQQDAFKYLHDAAAAGTTYDLVILDPPSFAKNRKTVTTALQGYRTINRNALRLLKPGGILATASCSQLILEEAFLDSIERAARAEGKTVTMLEWHGASPDHPVLPAMPETKYLKFGIFAVR